MKRVFITILLTVLLSLPAFAEPAKTNKKLEYRFYEGCTVEQVKNAARIAFTSEPLKLKAPITTYSQRWEEDAESVMSSEPKIMFTYKNVRWIGKFIQKDNGVEAHWLYGGIVNNLLANAFVFGVLAAGVAASSGQGYSFQIDSATKINKLYGYPLEKIEVELKLRDSMPEIKKEEPKEQTEEAQE